MKYKIAFSLVEMLMALLVASLLLAALAPVMTKRLNENVNVTVPSTSDSGYKIFTTDDADCEDIEGQNYMKCAFTVPADVEQINVYMQGGGGGAFSGGADNGKAGNGGNGTDGYIYIKWNILR